MTPDQFDRAALRIMDKFSETLALAVADAHEGIGSLKDRAAADGELPANAKKCADELSSLLGDQLEKLRAEVARLQGFIGSAIGPEVA